VGQIAPPDAVSREQCACYPGYGGRQGQRHSTDGWIKCNSRATVCTQSRPTMLLLLGLAYDKGRRGICLLHHAIASMLFLVVVHCSLAHARCAPMCPNYQGLG